MGFGFGLEGRVAWIRVRNRDRVRVRARDTVRVVRVGVARGLDREVPCTLAPHIYTIPMYYTHTTP